jgi:hypothetical protein
VYDNPKSTQRASLLDPRLWTADVYPVLPAQSHVVDSVICGGLVVVSVGLGIRYRRSRAIGDGLWDVAELVALWEFYERRAERAA